VYAPVRALVIFVDDADDEVAGWVDEYPASGLYSDGHLVDRLRLVRPPDAQVLSRVFDGRRPGKHGDACTLTMLRPSRWSRQWPQRYAAFDVYITVTTITVIRITKR